MNLTRNATLLFSAFLSMSIGTAAQSVGGRIVVGSSTQGSAPRGSFSCGTMTRPMLMGVAGPTAPYSATQEFSSVQTLADGTHISQKHTEEKIFRDSQGRTRTERPMCPRMVRGNTAEHAMEEDPEAVLIEIHDPVAGFAYVLDVQNRIAYRFTLSVRERPPQVEGAVKSGQLMIGAGPKTSAVPNRENGTSDSSEESLGTQTMEGVTVEGKRTNQVIPVGEMGNDRPLTIVREVWRSPDLNLEILDRTLDPRSGEHTRRVTNLDTSEPSPLLFQAPPGYKIEDATDSVHIEYKGGARGE